MASRSIEYHRAQLRAAFGFREFTRGEEDKLAGWLAQEDCPVALGDEALREAVDGGRWSPRRRSISVCLGDVRTERSAAEQFREGLRGHTESSHTLVSAWATA